MKTLTAAAALVALLALVGCTETPTAAQEPEAPQTVAQAPAQGAEPEPAPFVAQASEASTEVDAAFLAEVERRQIDASVLDNFTDAEVIALGHEACEQIGAGIAPADLRLVDGEEPTKYGYWMDSSAVLNSALLSYCPELIEDVD